MTRARLILIAAGGSLALLAGALMFQAMGYAPCKLCLWQRWPHAAAIGIGALALAVPGRVLLWLGAAAAAASGALGVYHTGVEQGWWAGLESCTGIGAGIAGLSVEDLLNPAAEVAPLVRCDEVAWWFAGLSMASWNAILSFALAAIWIAAARRTV